MWTRDTSRLLPNSTSSNLIIKLLSSWLSSCLCCWNVFTMTFVQGMVHWDVFVFRFCNPRHRPSCCPGAYDSPNDGQPIDLAPLEFVLSGASDFAPWNLHFIHLTWQLNFQFFSFYTLYHFHHFHILLDLPPCNSLTAPPLGTSKMFQGTTFHNCK